MSIKPDDPLMGMDAREWAREFLRIWSGRWSEVDEGLMISWFANAIMRGFDEGRRRADADIARLKAEVERLTPNQQLYPCANCGKLRTKAEGGAVFTVCDSCWNGTGRAR